MLNYYIKSNLLFTDKVKVFVKISHAMNLLSIQNLNGVKSTMYLPFHRKKNFDENCPKTFCRETSY